MSSESIDKDAIIEIINQARDSKKQINTDNNSDSLEKSKMNDPIGLIEENGEQKINIIQEEE